MACSSDLPGDWADQVVCAYTVFGVDPGPAAELGIGSKLRSALTRGLRGAWEHGDPEWVKRVGGRFAPNARSHINIPGDQPRAVIPIEAPSVGTTDTGTLPDHTAALRSILTPEREAALQRRIAELLNGLPSDPETLAAAGQQYDPADGGPPPTITKALQTMRSIGAELDTIIDETLRETGHPHPNEPFPYVTPEQMQQREAINKKIADEQLAVNNEYFQETIKEIVQKEKITEEEARARIRNIDHLSDEIARQLIPVPGIPKPTSNDPNEIMKYSDLVYDHLTKRTENNQRIKQLTQQLQKLEEEQQQKTQRYRESPAVRAAITRDVLRAAGVQFGLPEGEPLPYQQREPYDPTKHTLRPGTVVHLTTDDGTSPVTIIRSNGDRFTIANGTEITSVTKETIEAHGQVEQDLDPETKAKIAEALSMMPTEYIGMITKGTPAVNVVRTGNGRPHRTRDTIHLDDKATVATVLHEEHHGIEFSSTWIQTMEWAVLVDALTEANGKRRALKGTRKLTWKERLDKLHPKPDTTDPDYQPQPLDQLLPGMDYRPNETTFADNFHHPYLGKVYFDPEFLSNNHLAGVAFETNYELLTMTAEEVLAGNDYSRTLPPAGPAKQQQQQQQQQQLRNWYLGQITYAALTAARRRKGKD